MTAFAALLRAINVGGTGKLPMGELVELCTAAGFKQAKTYIQSGNVVFRSALTEAKAQQKLQRALTAKLGKEAGVTLRTGDELDASKTTPIRAGGIFIMQPSVHHFGWASEETIVQVHGVGPWGITYVNPADDPAKRS